MSSIRCYVRIRSALLSSGSVGAFEGSGGGRRGQDDPWNDVGELGMSGEDGLQPLKRPPRYFLHLASLQSASICGWKRKREEGRNFPPFKCAASLAPRFAGCVRGKHEHICLTCLTVRGARSRGEVSPGQR